MAGNGVTLAVNLGLLVAMFGLALAVTRYTRVEARRRALPQWQRLALALAAFGPFTYLLQNQVTVPLLDGTVVAIAVFLVLWIGLFLLATSIQGVEPASRSEC